VGACLLAALLPVLIRLSLLPVFPIPEPKVHDEFSYLLGAETFASGRLTNPPHPMWVHFETFHVNHQPTYMAKYPPGQSMVMALGQTLFGHPWYGVLMSVGLMCATICWMLQGWLPVRYAILGSIATIIQLGIGSYWVNSYWGGALTAAGGALVVGALPRLARRPTTSAACMGALGAVVLANTRPYEGLILSGASVVALIWWRYRLTQSVLPFDNWRRILPAVCLLGLAAVWMGYFNYRVTGPALSMPYAVNQKTYAASPHFWFLPDRPIPEYRHEVLRKFWANWDRDMYIQSRGNPLLPAARFLLLMMDLLFPLSLPLLFSLAYNSNRKLLTARAIAAAVGIGIFMEKGSASHYYAPAISILILFVAAGFRFLVQKMKVSRFLLLAEVILIFSAYQIANAMRPLPPEDFRVQRREIIHRLTQQPESRHLVLIRYSPDHPDESAQWVYNSADIDSSQIVWAQDMGQSRNQELVDYYPDRKVWVLEVDLTPVKLSEYPLRESKPTLTVQAGARIMR
jgi:hypothetical protein